MTLLSALEGAERRVAIAPRTLAVGGAQGFGMLARAAAFVVAGRAVGTDGVGLLASAISVGALASLLVGLGFKNAAIRYLSAQPDGAAISEGQFLHLARRHMAKAFAAVGLLAALLAAFAFGGQVRAVLLIGVGLGSALSLLNFHVEVLRARNYPLLAALFAHVAYPGLTLAGLYVLVGAVDRWWAAAIGFLVAALGLGVVLDRICPKVAVSAVSAEDERRLLRFSAPLVISGMAQMSMAQLPVLILLWRLGADASGAYAVAYRLAAFPALATAAVNASLGPSIVHDLRSGDPVQRNSASRQYRTLLVVNGTIVVVVTSVLALASSQVLGLYGSDFVAFRTGLLVLLAGLAASASVGPVAFVLIGLGQNIAVTVSYAIAGAVTLVALLFVSSVAQAALVVTFGMVLQTLSQAVLMRRAWRHEVSGGR